MRPRGESRAAAARRGREARTVHGATLRKSAGAALRYLKGRSAKNFAFLVRESDATAKMPRQLSKGPSQPISNGQIQDR